VSDYTKGVTVLLEGLFSREGKVGDEFVLVISIARWNHMQFGSAPWNNESTIIDLEDKWRRIAVLDIGCNFDFYNGF